MGSDDQDDKKWSWQEHVNTYFPDLIFIATVILITMLVMAYIIL